MSIALCTFGLPILIFVATITLRSVVGRTLKTFDDTSNSELGETKNYLSKYGWIKKSATTGNGNMEYVDIREPVKEFQRFFGLEVTGHVNNDTSRLIHSPRCGVPDKFIDGGTQDQRHHRHKRYIVQEPRWLTRLTYKLNQTTNKYLTHHQIKVEIAKAFRVWEAKTNLVLSEVSSNNSNTDIDIRFVRGNQSYDNFGELDASLANAYFPRDGGDIHFNDYKEWSIDGGGGGTSGYSLFQVAVHEIGHALGLGHSKIEQSVMYPIYIHREKFSLHEDDISGIQVMYGQPGMGTWTGPRSETKPTTKPETLTTTEVITRRRRRYQNKFLANIALSTHTI